MAGRLWILVLLLAVGFATAVADAEQTPRMSKEELKGMLDNPDLVIVDVRTGKDWDASEFKVRGARRMEPDKFDSWKGEFPKDNTIVLYCA
jgi:rhodanese-related sulfurtransferase